MHEKPSDYLNAEQLDAVYPKKDLPVLPIAAEVRTYRAALDAMLRSAAPNAKDHPTMWDAWGDGAAALGRDRNAHRIPHADLPGDERAIRHNRNCNGKPCECGADPQRFLRIGDTVRFKATGQVAKVARFAHDGTTDFWADNETGPYKQADVDRLIAL